MGRTRARDIPLAPIRPKAVARGTSFSRIRSGYDRLFRRPPSLAIPACGIPEAADDLRRLKLRQGRRARNGWIQVVIGRHKIRTCK